MSLHGLRQVIFPGFTSILKGNPFAFGINVSDRCPIGCDCYWRASARVDEMKEEEMIDFMLEKRNAGYVVCFLIGGEPYVRPKLLQKIAGIIPVNILVTSGTTPLLSLPKTLHFISVDGKDTETHDKVRQSKGLFQRIIRNLENARKEKFPAYIHTVLNSLNYTEIGDILKFWERNGLVDGLIVSTITPVIGQSSKLDLTIEQRERVVEDLLGLKDKYPRFLRNTRRMIQLLHPDHTKDMTPAKCQNAEYFPAFDASGKKIPKCIFGPKADCSSCGCIVTSYADSLVTWSGFISAVGFGNQLASISG